MLPFNKFKKTLSIGVFFLSSLAVAETQGLTASLTKIKIDPNLDLARFTTGRIEVQLDKKLIRLTLQKAMNCPRGLMCAMVMPQPLVVTVPLTKIEPSLCGTMIYQGEEDKRPADGSLRKIVVSDNSEFYKHCRSVVAVPETLVTLDTIPATHPQFPETHSQMEGKKLESY